MRLLFMNGRHWKIMLIITMQYPLGIPPNLRTNIDYVFILRENIGGNRKRIYTNYASMFPTFEAFCSVLDSCTENYECLVINNNSKSKSNQKKKRWIESKIILIYCWKREWKKGKFENSKLANFCYKKRKSCFWHISCLWHATYVPYSTCVTTCAVRFYGTFQNCDHRGFPCSPWRFYWSSVLICTRVLWVWGGIFYKGITADFVR